jgi:hypothetical protein
MFEKNYIEKSIFLHFEMVQLIGELRLEIESILSKSLSCKRFNVFFSFKRGDKSVLKLFIIKNYKFVKKWMFSMQEK